MTNDFTSGLPIKHVIRFAFPLFLGMILQQLYSIIDAIIVGQKIGVEALAGVGSTGAISFMVIGFHMSVEGPAIATIISQAFSGGLCLIQMRRGYKILKFQSGERDLSWKHIRTLSRLAIPMGLQTSVTGIGIMTLQGAINNLGMKVVAGVTTGLRINNFFNSFECSSFCITGHGIYNDCYFVRSFGSCCTHYCCVSLNSAIWLLGCSVRSSVGMAVW